MEEKPTKDVEAGWHVKQDSRPPVCHLQTVVWPGANTGYEADQNLTFYGLAAMASNIRKGAKFLTLYAVRRSVPQDKCGRILEIP